MKKIIFTLSFIAALLYTANAQVSYKLYGMTYGGGIFSYDPVTAAYTKLKDFDRPNGNGPYGSLTRASDGKLYGTTIFGGAYNGGGFGNGVIFSYDPVTAAYTKLVDFDGGLIGAFPTGNLIQASDGKLYGMAEGGSNGSGVIFSYNPSTAAYISLVDLDDLNGANPSGSLIQTSDGKLYGMTYGGGSNGIGVIFSYDLSTATYTKLEDFDGTSGGNPSGSLIQASDGKLYGMTYGGGSNGSGVIFSYDPVTAAYTKLEDFDGTNGGNPYGSLIEASDGKLYGITSGGGSNGIGVIFSYDISSTTYSKLEDFDGINGSNPEGSLMQASDGKLYGMTTGGGSNGIGVIFSYDPVISTNTKLLDFDGNNGGYPHYTSFIEIPCVITYYRDADGDGYGDAANSVQLCDPQMGYVTNSTDCNDGNGAINPNTKWYKDADNDGYSDGTMLTQCTRPTGYKPASELTATSGDCNDGNGNIKPGAAEICGNGIDDNCNGQVDENCSCVNVTVSASTISCYGGLASITVYASGGKAPYKYKLSGGPNFQLINYFIVGAGTYSVTVMDKTGCTKTISNIVITQPAPLTLTLVQKTDVSCKNGSNGKIIVSAGGGTAPYSYKLNSGSYSSSGIFQNLKAGTYTVTAKDAKGCIKSLTSVIKNGTGTCNNTYSYTGKSVEWFLDTRLMPNPSRYDFTLNLKGSSFDPVDIRVLDIYGRMIHQTKGTANQSYKFGQQFAVGIYIVEIIQGEHMRTIKVVKN